MFHEGLSISVVYIYPVLHVVKGLVGQQRLCNYSIKHYFALHCKQTGVDGSALVILLEQSHVVGDRVL